jgi:hypothetical protein
MSSKSNSDEKLYPTCTELLENFALCSTPPSQIDYYRKNGKLEKCFDHMSDWFLCVTAKLSSNPENKEVIYIHNH